MRMKSQPGRRARVEVDAAGPDNHSLTFTLADGVSQYRLWKVLPPMRLPYIWQNRRGMNDLKRA